MFLCCIRYSAQEAIEDPFLGVEPEVVVLSTNEAKNHLTLQVVFKGMDKLSVKFEFNADTDTAEEVVNEMVSYPGPCVRESFGQPVGSVMTQPYSSPVSFYSYCV